MSSKEEVSKQEEGASQDLVVHSFVAHHDFIPLNNSYHLPTVPARAHGRDRRRTCAARMRRAWRWRRWRSEGRQRMHWTVREEQEDARRSRGTRSGCCHLVGWVEAR